MDSLTDRRCANDLRTLNRSFWSGALEPRELVDSLLRLGYDSQNCVLFQLYPDSGSTWIVRLMDQECEMYELDIDVADPASLCVERIEPDAFRKRHGRVVLHQVRKLVQERRGAT